MATTSQWDGWRLEWLERERATARVVRACFDLVARSPLTAQRLRALSQLTWITKSKGEIADNTRAVVAPALSALLGEDLSAQSHAALAHELDGTDAPAPLLNALRQPIGFVNFYAAFRNSCETWLMKHCSEVESIFRRAASAQSDADVFAIYGDIQALPALPRDGAGDLPAYNLLTPVVACLDPRSRCPIINSREEVRGRLQRLGLANDTLVAQCRGLVGLLNQAGIVDAFALDTCPPAAVEEALATPRPKASAPARPDPAAKIRPLEARAEADVEVLREALTEMHQQRHNKMTNALRAICERAALTLVEGTDPAFKFDALIRAYNGAERHLLIEVKTSDEPAFCRMAVGQLLDYRRHLSDRAATDLAVLLPDAPSAEMHAFLRDVGVRALWLSKTMDRVLGDEKLGPSGG